MVLPLPARYAAELDGILRAVVVARLAMGAMSVPARTAILNRDILQWAHLRTPAARHTGVRRPVLLVRHPLVKANPTTNVFSLGAPPLFKSVILFRVAIHPDTSPTRLSASSSFRCTTSGLSTSINDIFTYVFGIVTPKAASSCRPAASSTLTSTWSANPASSPYVTNIYTYDGLPSNRNPPTKSSTNCGGRHE